ncbi:hypothetical protein B0H16DRAFT_158081 [Mycena metata]|uniref:Uncharacterized protein n=1 Tax=Mycena metata TaxID=1033252 RepID=A0AAD7I319_9AGAR|nr:hypothetical protein B0H16DRAFT_158081 [Mycena metata]
MTRRTVVDTILSAAVSLAETASDFAVLNAEEHNFSTVANKGVTFLNPDDNKTYLLSGPMDYIVTGLNSRLIAPKLAVVKQQPNFMQLLPSQIHTAIQGTNHTVCPIEAKATISGVKHPQALRQVLGEASVLCKARYKNVPTPLPFSLSDGENWTFGILSAKEIYTADLTWGDADGKDILKAIVIWTCSQPQLIWAAMQNALNPATSTLYGMAIL